MAVQCKTGQTVGWSIALLFKDIDSESIILVPLPEGNSGMIKGFSLSGDYDLL